MKKILTLLLPVGLASSLFAQADRNDEYNRDRDNRNSTFDHRNGGDDYSTSNPNEVAYDRHERNGYDDSYNYNNRRRDAQVARINRQYDRRINAVERNPFIGHYEKDRKIHDLEYERDQQIRMIYGQYDDRDRDDHFNRNHHWRF